MMGECLKRTGSRCLSCLSVCDLLGLMYGNSLSVLVARLQCSGLRASLSLDCRRRGNHTVQDFVRRLEARTVVCYEIAHAA